MGTKQIISKNISADSTQYIGKDGELWVDTVTNKMKISDGTTPGGVDLAGLGGGGGATTWADITNINNASGPSKVAVGTLAGLTGQGLRALAVGNNAGATNQGIETVALGNKAGMTTQAQYGIAIGTQAGNATQGQKSIAIGPYAGMTTQGSEAISIGHNAGKVSQGNEAIAIGTEAAPASQHANSIVLNASGTALNTTQTGEFKVKPVRNYSSAAALPSGFKQVAYNPTTGEFVYYGSAG